MKGLNKCGSSARFLTLSFFAISLALCSALFNAPSAYADTPTIEKCEIPLSVYTKFGEQLELRYSNQINGDVENIGWLAACDSITYGELTYVFYPTAKTTPFDYMSGVYNGQSWYQIFLNLGLGPDQYPSEKMYFRYFPASEYMEVSSQSNMYNIVLKTVGEQNSQYIFAATNLTNKTQAFIDAGLQIPVTGEDTRTKIKPDFSGSLDNKKVSAHDYNLELPTVVPDEGYTIVGYSVEWTLYKCSEFENVGNICSGATVADHQIQLQSEDYKFEVSDYGDYTLEAQYLVQQCYRYPSYPATPDYCFYVDLGTELPDYDFTHSKIYLEINGQTKTFDTAAMTCDESGFCYNDMDKCYLKESFFDKMTCEFQQKTTFGLLNPSLNAFKSLFTSLTVPNNPQCNIPLQNVQISPDRSFPLSQYSTQACNTSKTFRDTFPIAPMLINFFIGLTILILLAKIINQLTNPNEHDMIVGVNGK